MRRIYRFFFPPPDTPAWSRALRLTVLLAIPVAIVLLLPAAWEYSNSPEFCGTTCHTMPPEYNTYLVSPHARVLCVDCHIGRGSFYEQFARKTTHSRLLWATLTENYEYPIQVSSMRPARDTCELCHYPEKFSDDSLRILNRYRDNEDNDPYAVYLLMHTGGGTQREGLGYGIHWHVENKVEYIATDRLEQDIPWVRVTYVDGTTTEYVSTESPLDPAELGEYEVLEMDCITCHNRISHLLDTPEHLVDSALQRGDIPTDVPYIRARSVELLSERYESVEEARESIGGLVEYYRESYPDVYEDNTAEIDGAVDLLVNLWEDNTFPEQELDWKTHPNNIGHRNWPGCFRCHDGKHLNEENEVIRLECNLCHSIPQIVLPNEIEPMLPLTTGIEPSSHRETTWISRHHNEFDATCESCHTTANPGGTSDTSFCSNSGCHGTDWRYAGFDAPTLALELGIEQELEEAPPLLEGAAAEGITYQELLPVFEQACGQCHGDAATKGLKVTEYETLLAGSDDGPVIEPGAPEDSRILDVLAEGHFGELTEEQMALLEAWIAAGAPEGEAASEPEATEDAEAPAGDVTYADIQPALEEACGQCHGDAATKGLKVTEYETLLAGSDDGPVIEPGAPEDSRILDVLAEGHFGQLTEEQMALLEAWIAAGAPEGG